MNHSNNTYLLVCRPLKVAVFVGPKPFVDIHSAEQQFQDGLKRFLLISEKHGYEHMDTNTSFELKEYTLINS